MTITLATAARMVRLAIEDKGADYVFTDTDWASSRAMRSEEVCLYYSDESGIPAPRCIVGVGFDKTNILSSETKYSLMELVAGVQNLADEVAGVPDMTEAATVYLKSIQTAQDKGASWGDAREIGVADLLDWRESSY